VVRKDTVTADEEDDEVDADHHVGEDGPAVRHDAVVHHGVPVLTRQDLHTDRQTDRQADRQTDRKIDIQTHRHTERQTDIQIEREGDRQTDRRVGR